MFNGFGLDGSIHGAISPEPYTYGYETCTAKVKVYNSCGNTVTTP